MENEVENLPSSGYQPRPAAPPSAGRALSVLIAVCAVLWLWLMLPELWPLTDTTEFKQIVHGEWLGALVLFANYLVFRWATQSMWRGSRPNLLKDAKRGFVLLLCLLFHLLSPVCAFLLQVAIACAD